MAQTKAVVVANFDPLVVVCLLLLLFVVVRVVTRGLNFVALPSFPFLPVWRASVPVFVCTTQGVLS